MRTLVFLLLFGLLACGDKSTGPDADRAPVTVALQIDAEEKKPDFLLRICQELTQREIPATLFVNSILAWNHDHVIQELYLSGIEIALLSPSLGDASYDIQKSRLYTSYATVTGCLPCRTSHPVNGFRPEGFSQNEDTYAIADSMGFAYDAGFQARLLYAPGHEQEDRPYRIDGYDLVAVPVSTAQWQKERVCLSDSILRSLGATPEQWGELLIATLDEAGKAQRPLVLVVRDAVTGSEESPFLPPFVRFLEYAREREARFVTTEKLVIEYVSE